MDPEQIDRPGRHVEPAEPEAPEQNPADIELRFEGNQSPEVSSPAKVAEREDSASRNHSGPPLQNLEAEGSDDEAVVQLEPDVEESDDEADVQLDPAEVVSSDEEAVVQLEPEEVESSGDEADVGQLEPAGVGGAAEVIVVQQVSTDEESSRASSLEEEPHADEAGAEEPRRIDIRRRVPPNLPLVEHVLQALLGLGVDHREQAEAVGEWVAAGREAIANLLRGKHAMEAAAFNLLDVMVGVVGEREAAGQAAIANLHRGAHALEAAVVNLRDAMVVMEAGFGIGGDDNPAADPA